MILTHSQLALENSLRRILPPGVVSCWIPDGYGKAKDVIRGNHGQCFGTHPNVPIISSPINISSISPCDALADWSSTLGSLSIDADDKKEGVGSLKMTAAAPTSGQTYEAKYNPTGSWDWSNKKHKLFRFKCDRTNAAFSHARLGLYDTLGNYSLWHLTFSAGAWTPIKLLLSTPDETSATPADLALINYIRMHVRAADSTAFYYKLDDLKIANESSLINPSVGHYFGGDDKIVVSGGLPLQGLPAATFAFWINSDWDYNSGSGSYQTVIGQQKDWSNLFALVQSPEYTLDWDNRVGGAQDRNTVYVDMRPYRRIWCRVVGVFNAGNYKIFINAELKANGDGNNTAIAEAISGEDFMIGDNVAVRPICNSYIVLPSVIKGAWSQAHVSNDYLFTKGMFAPRG